MKIAIVGLGYVGIQLATALGKHYETVGFDLDRGKIDAYKDGVDPAGEVTAERLRAASRLSLTGEVADMAGCDVYIVAVPTPIDSARRPDFAPLISASRMVGEVMSTGSLVIFESTVYPGATEEVCVPVLEQSSGLSWPKEFNVGYSPERINPGDSEHTLERITKVVSADSPEALEKVKTLYGSIVEAGLHVAPQIRVAEAAKVIENTQRDLNIALVNELAVIFERMEINTKDVLDAAGTKWNFLQFRPGLVGGHCIGVDPYYLTHRAQQYGYHPEVILAGRRINDSMGKFVAEMTIKRMLGAGCEIRNSRVNIFGFTFKENCPDIRNTQVMDIVRELKNYAVTVSVTDALADSADVFAEYGVKLLPASELPSCDAVILAVPHAVYLESGPDVALKKLNSPGVFVDIKSIYDAEQIGREGRVYWSL